MAFSTSSSTALFLVATVCCLVANASASVNLPLPSVVDRQSRQVYNLAPSQLYNYYNPYEYQIFTPAEGEIIKLSTDSESIPTLEGKQNLPITAAPALTECLLAETAINGMSGCTKGSQAASGNIDLKFTEAQQGVVIALVPNQNRYSKVKITCSDITAGLIAFTNTAKIEKTADTPVTESKQTQILVVSAADGDVFKCSWESS